MHLQNTHSTRMPHELQEKEDKAKKTVYNPRDLVASVFLVVNDLVELAALATTPISLSQQVNICYVILHKTGKVLQPIMEWNRKPIVYKTWANFKTHFRTDLQEVTRYHGTNGPGLWHAPYRYVP